MNYKTKSLFLCGLTLSALVQSSIGNAVEVTRMSDGEKCKGHFLKTKSASVLATVAHCLGNYTDGGLKLVSNGSRSTKAFVTASVRSRGVSAVARGEGDDEFALVVFERKTGDAEVAINRSLVPNGSSLDVVGRRGRVKETSINYNLDKAGRYPALLITTNRNDLGPNDSGSAILDAQERLVGLLYGGRSSELAFVSTASDNPTANEVIAQFEKAYPGEMSNGAPTQTRVEPLTPEPIREILLTYTCSAGCLITYQNRGSNKRSGGAPSVINDEPDVECIISRVSSIAEAETQAKAELVKRCESRAGSGTGTLKSRVTCRRSF